jgi:hypothetical protein
LPLTHLVVEDPHLVIAGFTGRDDEAVGRHVDELRAQGIATPPVTPVFWMLPNWLLILAPASVEVGGPFTCGEVEPVFIWMPSGEGFVAVGSDHTDRELERTSLELAKQACPKVLSREVWRMDELTGHWDSLRLRAYSGEEETPYQEGGTSAIRLPTDLLTQALQVVGETTRPMILFLGTVPLLTETFVFTERFLGILEDAAGARILRCAYRVAQLPGSNAAGGRLRTSP